MRNLKRALSLTLASVMLLGMMVVGSSAAKGYPDVAEDDNVEAIEVVQAVGVMVGDENGNFRPGDSVSRAEMAVVMGKLLNLDYNYYEAVCPFTDVAGVYDWARGWVGAAAANGIVSGRGDGIYDPGATVTAVEAASMMMRALGYFRYANDYTDGFEVSTVRQGTTIGIFEGVGSSATAPMTRNQVAQMVLNALQTGMVEPDGNTINLTTPDGTVLTGKVNYVNVTSAKAFAHAISWTQATSVGSTNDGWIVELGEQLYDGKLKLNDTTDPFMRPARQWEFDGKSVGTYVKVEQLRQEWSVEVTGRMLYDVLTKPTIDDYDFTIAVDGVETLADNKTNLGSAFFTEGNLIRSNTEKVGETGNGVLTQVFVDTDNERVYIAVINTYLAKALADYNEKREEATFEVWSVDDKTPTAASKFLVKNTDEKETLAISNEDFDVEDVKKDDIILVQVADGEVQNILDPEVIDGTEISAFKKDSWVNAEGTQYNYADAIQYDDDVLDEYDQNNMKDTTYRIFLDKYGYAIGVEIIEEADNYVFLTGIDGRTSNLVNKTAEGNIIHLDGTMETVKINMEKSRALKSGFTIVDPATTPYTVFKPAALWNTWCTYTVDGNGVYTLTQVANSEPQMNADDNGVSRASSKRTTDKVGQGWDHTALTGDNVGYTTIIDKSHIGLDGFNDSYSVVYGNDDTIYINVSVSRINDADRVNPYTDAGYPEIQAVVINDVDSVATGAQNVSLKAYNYTTLNRGDTSIDVDRPESSDDGDLEAHYSYGVYNLFDNDGFVIAAVVVGEDDGTSSVYAYAYNDTVSQEAWGKDSRDWTWTKTVIIDGEEVTLTEVGDSLSGLKSMTKNNWYEVKLKADGTVKSVTAIQTLDAPGAKTDSSPAGTHTYAPDSANEADNVKDDIFCTNVDHFGGRATDDRSGTGNKYPKYIGKIEMVRNALEDNSSGKVVLFENMYTGNTTDPDSAVINGEALKYTLSAAGNSLQVMNATGGRVKGFSISPNAKTVLVQDKRVIDSDGNQIGGISAMSTREYFTGGGTGLASAISKLNLNKNATGERFRGYVSAVFENGVAQTVIIYEKLPNDVNWGSNTGKDNNTDKINVNVSDPSAVTLTYEGTYNLMDALTAIRNKLEAEGYTVTDVTENAGTYAFKTTGGVLPLTFYWNSGSGKTEMVTVTINGASKTVAKVSGALSTLATTANGVSDAGSFVSYKTGDNAAVMKSVSDTVTPAKGDVYDFGYYKVTLNTTDLTGGTSNGGASSVGAPDDMEAGSGVATKYVKAADMTVDVELTLKAVTTGVVKVSTSVGVVTAGGSIPNNKAVGDKCTVTVSLTEAQVKTNATITLSLADSTEVSFTLDGHTLSYDTSGDVPGNWVTIARDAGILDAIDLDSYIVEKPAAGAIATAGDKVSGAVSLSITDGKEFVSGYHSVKYTEASLEDTTEVAKGGSTAMTSGTACYAKRGDTITVTMTTSTTGIDLGAANTKATIKITNAPAGTQISVSETTAYTPSASGSGAVDGSTYVLTGANNETFKSGVIVFTITVGDVDLAVSAEITKSAT